jgi:Arc/MetJ-type ribon-helix-helix transcriptional regulator
MPAKKTSRQTGKAPSGPRRSRVCSISLPPELAARAEAIAKEESRTISEVFRTALRCYERERGRISSWLEETRAYAATRNPRGYTEEDVPRLVKEVRAEMRAEQERRARKVG